MQVLLMFYIQIWVVNFCSGKRDVSEKEPHTALFFPKKQQTIPRIENVVAGHHPEICFGVSHHYPLFFAFSDDGCLQQIFLQTHQLLPRTAEDRLLFRDGVFDRTRLIVLPVRSLQQTAPGLLAFFVFALAGLFVSFDCLVFFVAEPDSENVCFHRPEFGRAFGRVPLRRRLFFDSRERYERSERPLLLIALLRLVREGADVATPRLVVALFHLLGVRRARTHLLFGKLQRVLVGQLGDRRAAF